MGSSVKTALEHPLVTGYLRTLDSALASLDPGVAAELSEQFKTHIVDALPPDASDDMVAEVLAALGPPAAVCGPRGPALAAKLPSPAAAGAPGCHPDQAHPTTNLVDPRTFRPCGLPGCRHFIFWEDQPSFYSGEAMWWYSIDRAHDVNTEAAFATQDTAPLRPGQLQGIAVQLENPSDVTQRILGTPQISGTPYFQGYLASGTTPPQIAVATTSGPDDNPYKDHYAIGGSIPPHSYRWVRVIWRSWHCLFNVPGGWIGTNQLTLRVRVGWITRTEAIQLPVMFALSQTKANLDAAYCEAHGGGFQPQP